LRHGLHIITCGPLALDIMKKIKGMLDPNNILNPGKIWEEEA
jgi:FAD/FMN-containing dehydrogenase